jgi:N-acetylneuraminic acid mutarotase
VARNAIWYAGGIGESLLISADLFRFDLATETWARMPPMPTARDHLRMEALGGRLFAISGRQDDLRSNLAATERYDIDRGTWTRVADVEQARSGFGSAVLGGHIYIFGGEELWTCLAQIERYDPGRDRWEVLGEMPEARHGVVAGVIDGRIHLASGGTHPRVSISGIHRVYQPRPPAPSGARS